MTLSLVIPGLLGPFPDQDDAGFPLPDAHVLAALLQAARASGEPASTLADWLGVRLGIAKPAVGDWPSGPLCAAVDVDPFEAGYWLHADPVHLRADRSRLLLFGADLLDIGLAEAHQLAAACNDLYAQDGWRLHVAAADRWYLRLPDAPLLETTPVGRVLGRDVDLHLPRGPDARHWRGVLNEIQMLFHGHAVNRAREQQGRPLINSLWLWGGGNLPAVSGEPDVPHLVANDFLARGLVAAQYASGERLPRQPGNWLTQLGPDRDIIVVLDPCAGAAARGDSAAWCQAVETLERQWLKPLQQLLRQRHSPAIRLLPLHGTAYELRPGGWLQRWRRPASLRQWMSPGLL